MENKPTEKSKVRFKMTFANSWWQCLIALAVGYYIVQTILLIAFALVLGNNDQLAIDLADIGWLGFEFWFSWWLSYRMWKKKQTSA